ncbi:MAG: hypothetical protein JNJ40_11660 [Bacteroidia bacterium]|nr:hypothetical protein [Bacteroidia bacterium]
MNRRSKYIIFLIAIVCFFFSVFFVTPTKVFLFENSMGDCNGRARFMYSSLYKQKNNADVVFFGSSRTMNSVNDTIKGKHKLLNLGYCRFGRNLDHFFIEEYLETHAPSEIILEVRADEGSNSHPMTPFLMPMSKVCEGFKALDGDVFSNLYNKWLFNLKYVRFKLFEKDYSKDFINYDKQGFLENLIKTDVNELNLKRAKDSVELISEDTEQKKLNHNSEFYFKKVKALCDQKNIKLRFLYLPNYGNVYKKPLCQKSYEDYGQCIIPPDSIFCDPSNFADYNHLNGKGAIKFSAWLNNFLESGN